MVPELSSTDFYSQALPFSLEAEQRDRKSVV